MTQIEQVNIPILLPKRGKGHQEVMASFSVSTSRSIDPLTFISVINAYANKTCVASDMVSMSKNFAKTLDLDDVEVKVIFSYILDRVSSRLSSTFFSLPCFYERSIGSTASNLSMGVTLPIQTLVGKPISSTLTLRIDYPSNIFFEDMVDRVYKVLGAVLCPVTDKDSPLQGPCYFPEDALKMISDACKEKKLGRGGWAKIEATDIYHMYKLVYTKKWGK
jgi:hypothetical protein